MITHHYRMVTRRESLMILGIIGMNIGHLFYEIVFQKVGAAGPIVLSFSIFAAYLLMASKIRTVGESVL